MPGPGEMEEIDVAALRQGVGQRHLPVADALMNVDRASLLVWMVEIPLAGVGLVRLDHAGFEKRRRGQRLEDRAGRQGHLDGPVEQRVGLLLVGQQGGPLPAVASGAEDARIESRRGGAGQQLAALDVHDHHGAAGRIGPPVADRPPRQGTVEQLLGGPLEPWIQREDQVAADARRGLAIARQDAAAVVADFDPGAAPPAEQ